MYRIICRISGGHVLAREYFSLKFLNDCSEFAYTRLVLFETENSSNLAASKSKAPRTPVVSVEVSPPHLWLPLGISETVHETKHQLFYYQLKIYASL